MLQGPKGINSNLLIQMYYPIVHYLMTLSDQIDISVWTIVLDTGTQLACHDHHVIKTS